MYLKERNLHPEVRITIRFGVKMSKVSIILKWRVLVCNINANYLIIYLTILPWYEIKVIVARKKKVGD